MGKTSTTLRSVDLQRIDYLTRHVSGFMPSRTRTANMLIQLGLTILYVDAFEETPRIVIDRYTDWPTTIHIVYAEVADLARHYCKHHVRHPLGLVTKMSHVLRYSLVLGIDEVWTRDGIDLSIASWKKELIACGHDPDPFLHPRLRMG